MDQVDRCPGPGQQGPQQCPEPAPLGRRERPAPVQPREHGLRHGYQRPPVRQIQPPGGADGGPHNGRDVGVVEVTDEPEQQRHVRHPPRQRPPAEIGEQRAAAPVRPPRPEHVTGDDHDRQRDLVVGLRHTPTHPPDGVVIPPDRLTEHARAQESVDASLVHRHGGGIGVRFCHAGSIMGAGGIMRTRRLALRRADLDGGVCPVPEECVEALQHRDTVPLVLDHRLRGITAERLAFHSALRQDVEWQFGGIEWPADLRPGVLLTVAYRPAKDEVVVRTVPLVEPMRVDGVDYFHEYDPMVVTREHTPGNANWSKVLSTVRRLGRVFDDGSAVFPEADLLKRSRLGRGDRAAFLLRNAVEQLLREGYVTRVVGSVDATGHPSYPGVDGEEPAEMLLYAPLVEPAPTPTTPSTARAPTAASTGSTASCANCHPAPSPRSVSCHCTSRSSNRRSSTTPSSPPGYTFVKKHHRNG